MCNKGIATNWVSLERLSLVYFFASTKFSKRRSRDACHLWFRSFDGSCSAMTSIRPPPASHGKGSRLVLSAELRGTSRLVRRLLIRIWGGRGGSLPWRKEKRKDRGILFEFKWHGPHAEIDGLSRCHIHPNIHRTDHQPKPFITATYIHCAMIPISIVGFNGHLSINSCIYWSLEIMLELLECMLVLQI